MINNPNSKTSPKLIPWQELQKKARSTLKADPSGKTILTQYFLNFTNLENSLTHLLLQKLRPNEYLTELPTIMKSVFKQKRVQKTIYTDLIATTERDPACDNPIFPFLNYKGFHALVLHRVNHTLWKKGAKVLALYLQSLMCNTFTIDIHPAAEIGSQIFIDHGHSLVIGETCKIKDGVSIMQNVTLGGTGNEKGDRHPKIDAGVLLGAGAKVLGNIKVGKCSKIGASSVVLSDVPAYSVVVGIPAKVVGKVATCKNGNPAERMNHYLHG